jgi:hypothetical protein
VNHDTHYKYRMNTIHNLILLVFSSLIVGMMVEFIDGSIDHQIESAHHEVMNIYNVTKFVKNGVVGYIHLTNEGSIIQSHFSTLYRPRIHQICKAIDIEIVYTPILEHFIKCESGDVIKFDSYNSHLPVK